MGISSAVKSHDVFICLHTRAWQQRVIVIQPPSVFRWSGVADKPFFFFFFIFFKSAYSGETAARYRLGRKTLPVHKLVLPASGVDLERRKRGNWFFLARCCFYFDDESYEQIRSFLSVVFSHRAAHWRQLSLFLHAAGRNVEARCPYIIYIYIYLYIEFTW